MRRFTLKERAVSLLLAAVLLLGLIPISGVLAKDDAAPTVRVTQDGAEVTAIDLPENEKTTLTAACKGAAAYQWQIQIPAAGVWVDIYDKTDAGCEVSSALVSSMLDSNNAARLRCTATVDETMYNSAAITVTLTESSAAAPQDEPLETAGYVVESETIIPPADTPAGDDTPADDTPADDTSAAQTDPAAADNTAPADDTLAEADTPTAQDEPAAEDDTPAQGDTSADTPAAADGTDPTADSAADDTPAGDDTPAAQADPAAGDDTAPANDTPAAQDASVSAEGLSAGSSGRTAAYAAARGSTGLSVQLLGAEGEGAGVMPLADDPDLTTYTVTIKYLYFNEGPNMNGSVASEYVATLAKGTSYTATVSSPIRTGYDPYLAEVGDWHDAENHWFDLDENGNITGSPSPATSITVTATDIAANAVYYVIYMPSMGKYRVNSYLQNIYDDFYSFGDSREHDARVGTAVTKTDALKREGYSMLEYDDATVAADNSTVLDIYYDREYHLINFQLDGGYGVTPIYARFQTGITVNTPTRAGYTFNGWEVVSVTYNGTDVAATNMADDSTYRGGRFSSTGGLAVRTCRAAATELAAALQAKENMEMPPFDVTLKAKWTANSVQYSIVYWKQNANDDNYSYWGTKTVNASAGDTVTFDPNASDFKIENQDFAKTMVQTAVPANGKWSAIPDRHEYEYFHYNSALDPGSVVVNGDGSTVLNVYYDRNTYNLKFYYARTNSDATVTETTNQEYVPATEIINGQSYIVVMNRAVTNGAAGSVVSTTKNGYGLKLEGNVAVGGDALNTLTALTFTSLDATSEGYPLYYVQNASRQYLTIDNNSASFTNKPTKVKVAYVGGYWALGCGSYWLNHHGSGYSVLAAGYTEGAGTSGVNLLLYSPTAAIETTSVVTSDKNWSVATKTEPATKPENATWGGNVGSSLPVVKNQDGYYTFGYDIIGDYRYEYLLLSGVRYNQDITQQWPAGIVQTTGSYSTPEWAPVDGSAFRTRNGDNATIKVYSTVSPEIIVDPDNPDATQFVAWWCNVPLNDQNFHLYYSALPNEVPDVTRDGVGYVLQPTVTYKMVYNGWTQIKEMQIYGMKLKDKVVNQDYNRIEYGIQIPDSPTVANEYTQNSYFYYQRNEHKLKFFNLGAEITGAAKTLVYGQSISAYENTLTKEVMEANYYPSVYEKGVYEFKGWSLSPDAYIPVEWDTLTMDDADLSLYAYWEKVTRTVTFYETYTQMINDQPIANDAEIDGNTYANPVKVEHGNVVNYATTMTREGYTFVGWFYIDSVTGEPTAFLPNNMPVTEDLNVYAEWQSTRMVKYTIHYKLVATTKVNSAIEGAILFADGNYYKLDYSNTTQIADDTTGQLQDGRSKTFTAKALPELWAADDPQNPTDTDYCHDHYPLLSNHTIMFTEVQTDPDTTVIPVEDSGGNKIGYELEYTFYYVYLNGITYTIQYINKDTGDNVFEDVGGGGTGTKKVYPDTKTTHEAVTTDRFKYIPGYIPDQYQKRLVLSAQDASKNLITFYYTKSNDPMFFVEHLVEQPNGKWTQVLQEFGTGVAGNTIIRSADAAYEVGHTFAADQVWVNTAGEIILPEDENANWVGEQTTDAGGKISFTGKYDSKPDGATVTDNRTASGKLENGKILVLRFYYKLEKYSYTIQHKILTAGEPAGRWLFGNEAASTETGEAIYGTTITADASGAYPGSATETWQSKAYADGYWVDGSRENPDLLKKTLTITEDSAQNVITFWYVDAPVEVEFRAKIGDEVGITVQGCYVTPSQFSTSAHGTAGNATSVPTPAAGYRFDHWEYQREREDGSLGDLQQVPDAWVDPATHEVTIGKNASGYLIRDAIYYAVFEPITLTINKEAAAGTTIGTNETFLFRVQGKATDPNTKDVNVTVSVAGAGQTTIAYLPAGEYTVTELTSWSWRYGCTSNTQDYTVTADGPNLVTFTNARNSKTWLGGENSIINKFAAVP